MIRQLSNIKIFLFLFWIAAHAQTISKVDIFCDSLKNNSSVFILSNSFENQRYHNSILDSVKFKISLLLQDEGFFNYSFAPAIVNFSADSAFVNLTFSIACKNRALIKNIYFSPSSILDSTHFDVFRTLENSYFQKELLVQKADEILRNLDKNRFPFASIFLKGIEFVDSSNFSEVNLLLDIIPNEQAKIDKLLIEGNESTKVQVIARAIRIFEGDFYDEKKISEIQQNLGGLNYFASIENPVYYFNKEKLGVLKIQLAEKVTNAFNGILGYIPPAAKNTGYFTGDINISLRNLFGTGREAALKWSALNKGVQELELGYLEPWLFGYPINLNFDFLQLNQDSLFTKLEVSAGLEFLASQNFSASIFVETASVIPNEKTRAFNNFNSSFLTSGVNFKFDSRDNITFPVAGFLINNSYSIIKKKFSTFEKIEVPESVQLQKIKVSIANYLSLFDRSALFTSLNYFNIIGDKLELADLFQLGGIKSVRGYAEKQFYGNNIIWLNSELRYQLDLSSYFFLFYDLGYYKQQKNKFAGLPENTATIFGFGGGLSFETNFGIFSISYAINKGGSLSDGKIHFGFKNDF